MKLSKMYSRVVGKVAQVSAQGHYGPYGWEGPNKADKGQRLGSCNVTRCQRPGAYWFNKVMNAWYCTTCAHGINYCPLPDGTYLCSVDYKARDEYFDKVMGD